MSKCKVCFKTSKNNPHTKFFRFPKDPERSRIWAQNCNLSSLLDRHGSEYFNQVFRICSDHFHPSFIRWDGQRQKLIPQAVPNVYNATSIDPNPFKNVYSDKNTFNSAEEFDELFTCHDSEFQLQMIEHICRLCAKERPNLTALFGARGKILNLPCKIKYIPVEFSENDVMSNKICQECIKKLEDGYLFVQSCIEADQKLRVYLNLTGKKSTYEAVNRDLASASATSHDNCSSCPEPNPEPSMLRDVSPSGSFAVQHDYSGLIIGQSPPMVTGETSGIKERFQCHSCKKSFQTEDVLEAHSKAHSLTEDESGKFACEQCGTFLQNRFQLSTHLRRHFNEKPYKCDKCNARFYNSSHLRQHSFTHSPNSFSCEICKKSFLRKDKLIEHFRDIHQLNSEDVGHKKKSYKCNNCSKTFFKLSSLQRHWKSHWPSNSFLCAFCGKLFTRMDSLKKHYRIHTGERPYSCSICGFSFKQKGDCKKHEENH